MPIKGRSRALLRRVGRAEKDGTALTQGRSLPPAWTLVTPYCKRTRPGRGTNTKAAGFTSHTCLPPAPLPPFALRLAPTHLGWGTRRQFTRRSRDPPGSKRRQEGNEENMIKKTKQQEQQMKHQITLSQVTGPEVDTDASRLGRSRGRRMRER
jgi:hypothetical protein